MPKHLKKIIQYSGKFWCKNGYFFFFEETVLNVPFSPLYYKFYYDLFVWIPEIPVVV